MQSSINFMYLFPYGLYPVLMKDPACCHALGSRDTVPPWVKLCHSPPEFQPCPGLVVPLRTSAPEGERRGMRGHLSVVTKYLEKKYFRASLQISVFPKVPMPGDPQVLMAPYRHFSAVLNSYCLFPSWKPIAEFGICFSTAYPGQSCSSEKIKANITT